MKKDNYVIQSENLLVAIEIAIKAFKKYPPKNWNEGTFQHVIDFYSECKSRIINAEPKYRNMKSFKYLYEDVFTNFQESSGQEIEEFWKEIKKHNLPFKRENKLVKILKRKKIKDDIEYDFVIDVIVPYQQEGLINEEEVVALNQYISDFEIRKKEK
jgi:hypothetical protein